MRKSRPNNQISQFWCTNTIEIEMNSAYKGVRASSQARILFDGSQKLWIELSTRTLLLDPSCRLPLQFLPSKSDFNYCRVFHHPPHRRVFKNASGKRIWT